MVLKEGWLNRQMDQVSKSVETWPDWMKRASGLEVSDEEAASADQEQRETPGEQPDETQGRLRL